MLEQHLNKPTCCIPRSIICPVLFIKNTLHRTLECFQRIGDSLLIPLLSVMPMRTQKLFLSSSELRIGEQGQNWQYNLLMNILICLFDQPSILKLIANTMFSKSLLSLINRRVDLHISKASPRHLDEIL